MSFWGGEAPAVLISDDLLRRSAQVSDDELRRETALAHDGYSAQCISNNTVP